MAAVDAESGRTFDDLAAERAQAKNPQRTPLSLMQEMVADGHSFVAAYVDFHSRLLMPQ